MRCSFAFLVLVLCLPPNCSGQVNMDPRLEGAKLRIRAQNDQMFFQVGERIRLELTFTVDAKCKYVLDGFSSESRICSGTAEDYIVEPITGWQDPLEVYYRSCESYFEGGLEPSDPIPGRPVVFDVDLNEWVRFTSPGHYRVRVKSSRILPIKGPKAPVVSNELSIMILAAQPQWQEQTLQAANALLDGSGPVSELTTPDENVLEAAKSLRFLGTPAATRDMARRFAGTDFRSAEFALGLMGSPYREVALDEMRKLLLDPDFPVTPRFMEVISVLSLDQNAKEDLINLRENAAKQTRELLRSGLSSKQGLALQVSSNTLAQGDK